MDIQHFQEQETPRSRAIAAGMLGVIGLEGVIETVLIAQGNTPAALVGGAVIAASIVGADRINNRLLQR